MKKEVKKEISKDPSKVSRRDFIRTTAVLSGTAAALASRPAVLHAAGSDKIRVGVIGCGGRGTGAAKNCVQSSENVEIYAMGDIFKDRVEESLNKLKGKTKKKGKKKKKDAPLGEKLNVTPERCFSGFDAFKKVLKTDVNLVILASPPHFRPKHLRAAIEAGKHVFMEKPVAVDPAGARSVIETSEMAKKKGLAIVAGTQRRHDPGYIEVMKRIHDGAIGEVVGGQCYWNGGTLWYKKPGPDWSEMEIQIRNWLYFTWLSGDHIVEQHVHNIDVMNWAFNGPPVKCMGMGGRQVRTAPKYGNIFDHFAVEYEYANGARVLSMCRQMKGATRRVSERVVGTRGSANPKNHILGRNEYKYKGKNISPYVLEHTDLINSIQDNKPLNEGKRIAESTLTAIMGRMSAYTGREIKYQWVLNASKLDLSPKEYKFNDQPVRPVAVPGKTKLI